MFRIGARALAVLLSVVLLAACADVDIDAELAAAEASYAAGQQGAALVRLSTVLQADPDNTRARVLRGRIALRAGAYVDAAGDLERALDLGVPREAVALDLAEAWSRLGRHEAALRLLDEMQSDAATSDYWTVRGEAELAAGDIDRARAALERAAAGAESGRVLVARARLAVASGDLGDAEALLGRAVSSAPDDPAALVARGELYARMGRLSEAARDLRKAVDLHAARGAIPLEMAALVLLVQVDLAANDLDDAQAMAERLARGAPQSVMTAYARALVEYRRGRFDDAAALLQRALVSEPDNRQLRTLLGAVQLALGNFGQAEQHFLSVLASTPRDPAAIKLLAETRLRQQRPHAALDALRPLEGLSAEDSSFGLLSGLASVLAGDLSQGIVYLEQAAALDPANQIVRLELARAYLAAGRDADAAQMLDGMLSAQAPGSSLDAALTQMIAHLRAGAVDAAREAAAAIAADFPQDARALTGVATYHLLAGEQERARQLLEEAVRVDASFVPAIRMLAAARLQDGRNQEAEELLRRVLAATPGDSGAALMLADLLVARAAFGDAERVLRESSAAAPSLPTELALARLYVRMGRLDDAERQIEAASRLAPNDAEVTAMRGWLALQRGRAAEAVELLRAAADALDDRLGVVLALAQAEIANGEAAVAHGRLRDLAARAPRSVSVRFALGAAALALGDSEQALAIAKALQAEFPSQGSGYLLEAEARTAERRYDAAVEALTLAYQHDRSWPALSRLIIGFELAEREAEVLPLLESWVRDNAAHWPGRLALAGLLQAAGRQAEALMHYDEVIRLDAGNVVALNNAAWLANELGRPDALALAEQARSIAPDNAAVLDTLGWILLRQNRERDAIDHLRRAAELAPHALEIRYHLAQALVELDLTDQARIELEALLRDGRLFEQRAAAQRLLESL